jgi:hypothetical protein
MTIQLTTAAHCLAMLRSRNAVKDRIKAEGLKPAHYSAREITSWAILYLEDNRATLLPDAIAQARAMIVRGDFGVKAQRALCTNITTDAQRTKA